jgi:hypothetical protein
MVGDPAWVIQLVLMGIGTYMLGNGTIPKYSLENLHISYIACVLKHRWTVHLD